MPLYKTIHFSEKTTIYIWKITENLEQLLTEVILNSASQTRVQGMKSELHQRGFLSVRKMLQTAGYTDFDLNYNQTGKPFLTNNKHISISHSHQFATLIISDQEVGIDLEIE